MAQLGSKRELRALALRRRDALGAAQRADASRRITERILARPEFAAASVVLGYASMRAEVDTAALLGACLAAGKQLGYPNIDWATKSLSPVCLLDPTRLAPGRFDVPEPIDPCDPLPLEAIDLVLVPGVGFDPQGHRLGYGAGMYDGLLAQLPATCRCWGLAFDVQLFDQLPTEPHDRPVDAVVTETRWLAGERDGG